ncbi:MAG TPA: SDR family NAD(P)-dependent oxidoreductase [Burkholderiales bacterium]|nr:SDR family NAD(P)-dependent oxidoreductase [Burkholderiales bacterium]
MRTELKGKTAVVTGAAGTMGAAVVRAFLEDGLRVFAVDVRKASFPDSLTCDITDARQVEEAATQIGDIDILVNNAGILSNNKVEASTPEEWRKVMAVNLDGAFYMARAFVPGMKKKCWGRIVNTCSLAAKSGGITAGTAYTASKGAMTSLTFSLARELAAFGVTVNGISPAYVKTPMVTEQLTEAQRQALIAQIPVGRFCEPEEFAHVVRFLVSPLSGFITGEIVDLNGGLIMD